MTFQDIINAARKGTLTNDELTQWIMAGDGPMPTADMLRQIFAITNKTEPHAYFGWVVSGNKIATLPNNPATKPNAPSVAPAPLGGPSLGGTPSQSDWTHLMTRFAEFGIGAILVIIGLNAIVAKTKTGRTVIQVASGTARRVAK